MIHADSIQLSEQPKRPMAETINSFIHADEIVQFLKQNLQFKEVTQRILSQRVIQQASEERRLVITPDEIQTEADQLRRELRLEKASDTLKWLTDQHISPEDWETGIRDRLLTQKLMRSLFEPEVERFFVEHRLDFDRVLLYQIIVPYQQVAQEVFYQIEEQEISFYEAAHLYDIQKNRRHQCGCEGLLYRWNLTAEIAAIVFGATPGEVVQPVQTEAGYHLFMVEEFLPAQLTSEIRQEIIQRMFQEWLDSEISSLL